MVVISVAVVVAVIIVVIIGNHGPESPYLVMTTMTNDARSTVYAYVLFSFDT